MARKKDATPIEVLYKISTKFPWWVSVAIAVVVYFVCHAFATAEIAPAKNMNEFAPSVVSTVIKAVAYLAQFIVPLIFLVGAVASAFARLRLSEVKVAHPPGEPQQPKYEAGGKGDSARSNQNGTDIYPIWKSEDNEIPNVPIESAHWNSELLSALEWKRFEEVCAGLFEQLGFVARVAAFGPDGGIDIRLSRPPSEQTVAIVQCKSRGTSKVGVKVVRELHGVMTSARVPEGILVSNNSFSDDAQAYARANQIDLMDGAAILRSIRTLTDEQQSNLLRLATAGDYTTPTCPSCGIKMIRRNPSSGKPFWGCVHFPRCRSIINIAKT